MNKRLILVDIDGVVLDWMSEFKRFMIKEGYAPLKKLPERYDCTDWFGLPYVELHPLMTKFNNSEEFKHIPLVNDALFFMKKLNATHDFVAITACGEDRHADRMENLNNLFGYGFFQTVHCMNHQDSKQYLLSKYKPSFWIEDNLKNAELGILSGHIPILLKTPYNQMESQTPLIRVNCWEQIYNVIAQKYGMRALFNEGPI